MKYISVSKSKSSDSREEQDLEAQYIEAVNGLDKTVVLTPDKAGTNSAVSSATKTNEGTGTERTDTTPSGNNKKIKFKKAKKLKRITSVASSSYMKHMHDLEGSRFQNWTKQELVELLIGQRIELRNEAGLELISLRDLADSLYQDVDMPNKPDLISIAEVVMANAMARRIQNFWIMYQVEKKRIAEERETAVYLSNLNAIEQKDDYEIGNMEAIYNADNPELGYTGNDERKIDENSPHLQSPARRTGLEIGTTASKKKQNILDIPWQPPDWEKANKYADYVQPRKGGKGGEMYNFYKTTTGRHCCLGGCGEQLDLWEEGQISEFGIYGAGITNYFKFLKWLFWLFLTLSVVAVPSLILNIYGPNTSGTGLYVLATTTVGNLATFQSNTTVSISIPGCSNYGIYSVKCNLNGSDLARFYSILDMIVSGIIMIAYFWLKYFERHEEFELDKNTINASMFTLSVSGLPEDVTEEELIDHFQRLLGDEHSIVSVSLAYNNIQEIQECISRGNIIRSKVRLVHEYRYNCTKLRLTRSFEESENTIEKLRDELFENMKKCNTQLKEKEQLLEEYAEVPAKVVYAFVTFNKVISKEAALNAYARSSSIFLKFFYNHSQCMLRGKLLKVSEALEPSTIIWENLGYSLNDRLLRRTLTTFLSLLLVTLSLVMIFCSKYLSETTGSSNINNELCPANFYSLSSDQQQLYVQQNSNQLYCYCNQFSLIQQSQNSYCSRYAKNTINSQVLQYFAAFVVILVNIMQEYIMKYYVSFEKHHSEDRKGNSVFFRLFILKYINTALIFFINGDNVIMKKVFGITIASSNQFTTNWFNTIGVTIILVQLSDAFFTHVAKLWQYCKHRYMLSTYLKSAAGEKLVLTQDELNKMQEGPDCELSFTYAQIMSTLFVCLTFSTGIPLLYIIAAGNFFMYYCVEKFLFINMYKVPPHFNSFIGRRATTMIPYAVILHLAMSIWVLSNPELFDNSGSATSPAAVVKNSIPQYSIRDQMFGSNTFPLLVMLCAIVLYEFVRIVLTTTKCQNETTDQVDRRKSAKAQYFVNYTRAVQRNLIKGLSTYNVLQNPIYKEAFAITWKFAVSNNTVRSVRTLKRKAHVDADEDDADKVEMMRRTSILESEKKRKETIKANDANRYSFSRNRNFYGSGSFASPLATPSAPQYTPVPGDAV